MCFVSLQLVIGRCPRSIGSTYGLYEFADLCMATEKVNAGSVFHHLTRLRLACKEQHAQLDC